MSWPFGFNFSQPSQYINGYPTLQQSFYPAQFASNSVTNPLQNPYFDFSRNLMSFQSTCSHCNNPNVNGLIGQNLFQISQNCNIQLENNNFQEKNRNSHQNDPASKTFRQSQQEEEQVRMVRFRRRRTVKKMKSLISHNSSLRNDTKNIPKNYGKAMLSYIQKNTRQAKQLLSKFSVDFLQFMMVVKSFKSKINTIHDLREMWGQNEPSNNLKKCIRILSYHFMRKKCLPYIFNSRVKNYHTHIKYRKKIIQGIQKPENFTKIKQF